MVRKLDLKERQKLKKFRFTQHSVNRLLERYLDINIELSKLVEYLIDVSELVYVNTDNSINVGVDEYAYLVFEEDRHKKADYVLVTYKVAQDGYEHTTLEDKYKLALKGVER